MQIKILTIGKLKEKSYQSISEEFIKRLRPYCNLQIIELPPEILKVNSCEKTARKKEAEKILNKVSLHSYVITMDIEGKLLCSKQMSDKINDISTTGISEITFVIGGSTGLDQTVKKKAHFSLSLSKMTFTHQFARLMLLEQIYRSFKILNNEPYHK